ncbi:MAG: hypothetical protein ACREJ5_24355 [Geminicoccaceae bacterium]
MVAAQNACSGKAGQRQWPRGHRAMPEKHGVPPDRGTIDPTAAGAAAARAIPDEANPLLITTFFAHRGENCSISADWSSFIRTMIAVGDLVNSAAALGHFRFS